MRSMLNTTAPSETRRSSFFPLNYNGNSHTNIALWCVFTGGQVVQLIMEYLPLGSLREFLFKRKLGVTRYLMFAQQICEASSCRLCSPSASPLHLITSSLLCANCKHVTHVRLCSVVFHSFLCNKNFPVHCPQYSGPEPINPSCNALISFHGTPGFSVLSLLHFV